MGRPPGTAVRAGGQIPKRRRHREIGGLDPAGARADHAAQDGRRVGREAHGREVTLQDAREVAVLHAGQPVGTASLGKDGAIGGAGPGAEGGRPPVDEGVARLADHVVSLTRGSATPRAPAWTMKVRPALGSAARAASSMPS